VSQNATSASNPFSARPADKATLEEGNLFAPKFDDQGLIAAITTDTATGEVLMFAYMNAQALALTIETSQAHYWSRSRNELWHKGATSGQVQHVQEIRTDCDQDVVLLKVTVEGNGASCHVGYNSCFYRNVSLGQKAETATLTAPIADRVYDPADVYGKKD
jgi:phosphoribosyl-AMP cyclohydrolase